MNKFVAFIKSNAEALLFSFVVSCSFGLACLRSGLFGYKLVDIDKIEERTVKITKYVSYDEIEIIQPNFKAISMSFYPVKILTKNPEFGGRNAL